MILSLKAPTNTTPFSIPEADLRRHTLGFSDMAIFGHEDSWTVELCFCDHEGRYHAGCGRAESPYLALRAAESALATNLAKPRERIFTEAPPRRGQKSTAGGAELLKEIGL